MEFGYWLKKLSYSQYLKLYILGRCIANALVNTVGHAVAAGHEDELLRMRFLIDRDFISEERPNSFWRELLRNQLFHASRENPLPIAEKWLTKGHPFLDKYTHEGRLNLNELFWKQCSFAASHEHFEIRIADAVNTILTRYINRHRCRIAYSAISHHFLRDGKITEIVLGDFDLEAWRYDPDANPWKSREGSRGIPVDLQAHGRQPA